MGLIDERERESVLFFCLSTDTPETALLITICSIDTHQCDSRHSLEPNVPNGLETGRTYPHLPSH